MPRLVLPFLLLAAAVSAQQGNFRKTPETIQAEVEAEVIRARLELGAAERMRARLPLSLEMRKLEVENLVRAARSDAAAAESDAERARLGLDAALAAARAAVASADKDRARAELEVVARLANAEVSLEFSKVASVATIARLQQKVSEIAAGAKMTYPKDPLIDGVLHISDRRIPFNGVVNDRLAREVTSAIAFFNAQDGEAPIFIVIDRSPGGSVMSGYMILQAMETSKAPVYVVVKGYCASMAAIVTTLAKRSFVYPQTIVLHHQASTGVSGNMTQMQEQLKWSKVWCERIFVKVAARIGVPLDDFVVNMYKATSTGDWKVHGDEAGRMKWVTDVVERMNEDGVTSSSTPPPPAALPQTGFGDTEGRAGAQGRVREELPPSGPCDLWWIYDPRVEYIVR
jgi:ATP-dependent Clp protease protease subunit